MDEKSVNDATHTVVCPACWMPLGMEVDGLDLRLAHPPTFDYGRYVTSTIETFKNIAPAKLERSIELWAASQHDECGP